ncbi:MAG: hypothetical protein KatS3mg008_1905 [Acidimicrobiales bacterium]|nr:MAG: hypothetical protein KatS3mg008_1905 [Acidimicrobiales bacterium]
MNGASSVGASGRGESTGERAHVSAVDVEWVQAELGRRPDGDFEVVVRDGSGRPVVIRNHPLLRDGTPMPTLYWLVGRPERKAVGELEARGGVRHAESEVDPSVLEEIHRRYAAERDAMIPPDHEGPRPSGGVGGTRRGVKCLHAHLAYWLAGGEDPVGRWTADRLGIDRSSYVRCGLGDGSVSEAGVRA